MSDCETSNGGNGAVEHRLDGTVYVVDPRSNKVATCPCVAEGRCLADDEYPCIYCLRNPCPLADNAAPDSGSAS